MGSLTPFADNITACAQKQKQQQQPHWDPKVEIIMTKQQCLQSLFIDFTSKYHMCFYHVQTYCEFGELILLLMFCYLFYIFIYFFRLRNASQIIQNTLLY